MKNSIAPVCEAHEIIGFEDCPPAGFDPSVAVYTPAIDDPAEIWEFDLIGFDENVPACMARESARSPMGTDADTDETWLPAWDVLDEAYDSGVESQQVFLAHLLAVNIPECEGLRHLTEWRQSHTDPWIRAYDDGAELFCREVA